MQRYHILQRVQFYIIMLLLCSSKYITYVNAIPVFGKKGHP